MTDVPIFCDDLVLDFMFWHDGDVTTAISMADDNAAIKTHTLPYEEWTCSPTNCWHAKSATTPTILPDWTTDLS